MKYQLVKDWMTADPITVTPQTTLPDIHRLMNNSKIRRIPVLSDGKLVGIVTLGDVREAEPSEATSLSIWEINYLLAKLQVRELMTPSPITVSPNDTIGHVARIMLESKVGGLPVIKEDRVVVGIITESDIFRAVVQSWEEAGETK